MTRPRSQLISLECTPYYHCISRCVRRAFLCGDDHYSGKNFDHRKPWMISRLKCLGEVFAVDIAAYAFMSNHYHLVLHVDKDRAYSWSDDEVITHWLTLYKGPDLIHRYMKKETLLPEEIQQVKSLVATWRFRLTSISWFMSCLNEYIARRANHEDNCKGRFWEGRFKSQALLDETALVSCMAYVDLNPIRAKLCQDLSDSDFTSAQQRLKQAKKTPTKKQPRLMPFRESQRQDHAFKAIPFNLKDYLELVEWTGRHIQPGKRGHIPAQTPKLMATLGLSDTQWRILALDIQKSSILMLNGLDAVEVILKRKASARRAA